MQKLVLLGSEYGAAREELVTGLVKVVDKRLGRSTTPGSPRAA
jgi:hypothetical protein